MLAPWIIKWKEAERQRQEDEASWKRQPRLEAPRPIPLEAPTSEIDSDVPRGSTFIDFSI